MKTLISSVLAGSLIALPALADDKHHRGHKTAAASTQTAAVLSDGEVRKIDMMISFYSTAYTRGRAEAVRPIS